MASLFETEYNKHDLLSRVGNPSQIAGVRPVEYVDGNERKIELMSYLFMRMGVSGKLEISDETIGDIARFFATTDRLSSKKREKELRFLARVASKVNVSKLADGDLDRIATSALRVVATGEGPLKENVTTSLKSKEVSPSSPTLLSGSTR